MNSSDSQLVAPIPFPLADDFLQSLRSHAFDWCMAHGMISLKKNPSTGSEYIMHMPCTLLPSPFPKSLFELSWNLAKDFNTLVHSAANHPSFLLNTLKDVPDQFTQDLLKIHKTVLEEGVRQPICFGLHRSDYMLHSPAGKTHHLQQVEINTISSAMASVSSLTSQLHRYLIGRMNLSDKYIESSMPQNDSVKNLPRGLASAFKLYGNKDAVVVMLVQGTERNRWDQRWLEYNLWEEHKIPLIRCTLADISKGQMDSNGRLFVAGKEIAVVYFRAGYTPNDYTSESDWSARLTIERSLAIKCPNISYHLAGAKKVQQAFALPGVLEQLVSDPESIKRLRSCFTGLYSLAEGENEHIVKDAIANPRKYVLKPQREGGGNNLYGDDMKQALEKYSPKERAAYILMDRIDPYPFETYFMREGEALIGKAVSELGIYGIFIGENEKVFMNEVGGLLIRTKTAHVEDGGVAAGVAVLDSPYLI
eukprot:TRINITY_DN1839_c0_g1_i1.p1 TRINITY_DN1839_c0_g1~~TRINITY_DN1839_c0_g1_i1.p1  ORF type:complete len:478 (+),score=109.66 TRINITY_DN1839_c0_g1_i1:206-1639(+)